MPLSGAYACLSLAVTDLTIDMHTQYAMSGQLMTRDAQRRIPSTYPLTVIIAGCSDGVVRMWDMNSLEPIGLARVGTQPVAHLALFGAHRDRIFAVSGSTATVLSLISWRVITAFTLIGTPSIVHTAVTQHLAPDPATDPLVVVGYGTGHVEVWAFAADHDRNPPPVARPIFCCRVSRSRVLGLTLCPAIQAQPFRVMVAVGSMAVFLLEPGVTDALVPSMSLNEFATQILHLGTAILFGGVDSGNFFIASLIVPDFLLQQQEEVPVESTTLFKHVPEVPVSRVRRKSSGAVGSGTIEIKQLPLELIIQRELTDALPLHRPQSPAGAFVHHYCKQRDAVLAIDHADILTVRLKGGQGQRDPLPPMPSIPSAASLAGSEHRTRSESQTGHGPWSSVDRIPSTDVLDRAAEDSWTRDIPLAPALDDMDLGDSIQGTETAEAVSDEELAPSAEPSPRPGSHPGLSVAMAGDAELWDEDVHMVPAPTPFDLSEVDTAPAGVPTEPPGYIDTDTRGSSGRAGYHATTPVQSALATPITLSKAIVPDQTARRTGESILKLASPRKSARQRRVMQAFLGNYSSYSQLIRHRLMRLKIRKNASVPLDKAKGPMITGKALTYQRTMTPAQRYRALASKTTRGPQASVGLTHFDASFLSRVGDDLSRRQMFGGHSLDNFDGVLGTAVEGDGPRLVRTTKLQATMSKHVWDAEEAAKALMEEYQRRTTVQTKAHVEDLTANLKKLPLGSRRESLTSGATSPLGTARFGQIPTTARSERSGFVGMPSTVMKRRFSGSSQGRRRSIDHSVAHKAAHGATLSLGDDFKDADQDGRKGFSGFRTMNLMGKLNGLVATAQEQTGTAFPWLPSLPEEPAKARSARPPPTQRKSPTKPTSALAAKKAHQRQMSTGSASFSFDLPDLPSPATPTLTRAPSKPHLRQLHRSESRESAGNRPTTRSPRSGNGLMISTTMNVESEASETEQSPSVASEETETESYSSYTSDYSVSNEMSQMVLSVRDLTEAEQSRIWSAQDAIKSIHDLTGFVSESSDHDTETVGPEECGLSTDYDDPTLVSEHTRRSRSHTASAMTIPRQASAFDLTDGKTELSEMPESFHDLPVDLPPPPDEAISEVEAAILRDEFWRERYDNVALWISTVFGRYATYKCCDIDMLAVRGLAKEWHGASTAEPEFETSADVIDMFSVKPREVRRASMPDIRRTGKLTPEATPEYRKRWLAISGIIDDAEIQADPDAGFDPSAFTQYGMAEEEVEAVFTEARTDQLIAYFLHINAFKAHLGEEVTQDWMDLVEQMLAPAAEDTPPTLPKLSVDVRQMTPDQLLGSMLSLTSCSVGGAEDLEREWALTLRDTALSLVEDAAMGPSINVFGPAVALEDELRAVAASLDAYVDARDAALHARAAQLLYATLQAERERRLAEGQWPDETEPDTDPTNVAEALWAMPDDELEACIDALHRLSRTMTESAAMRLHDADAGPPRDIVSSWKPPRPPTPPPMPKPDPHMLYAAVLEELEPVMRRRRYAEEAIARANLAKRLQAAQETLPGMLSTVFGAGRGRLRHQINDAIGALTMGNFGQAVARLVGYDLGEIPDVPEPEPAQPEAQVRPASAVLATPGPESGAVEIDPDTVAVDYAASARYMRDAQVDPFKSHGVAPVEKISPRKRHVITEFGVFESQPLNVFRTPLGSGQTKLRDPVGLGSTLLDDDPIDEEYERKLRELLA
ncbi:Pancreatic hormone-like [Carpediemonas membranifera]|uniref:Pancreatic hormone-like n=1 Tax=Carpediemonas membranifera TaxID=201153 RepID=A0A8J6B7B0_9EUKA|nr:Pancreatic hormone-like [Carpediemonas membranifera]|eukprot:KAG9394262.1 Pancreatic hormone-like [Carpediemonas membranifera]